MPTVEERLAALETKLAALTETTPTTYYEHQYSGEEIDNAVARALPNGAIDQAAGTFVRPNLLDNWYFGRPVDQRRGMLQLAGTMLYSDAACTQAMFPSTKTTSIIKVSDIAAHPSDDSTVYVKLADCVRGYTGNGYTVDRWMLYTDGGNVAISNGYLDIYASKQHGTYLTQKIDPELAKALAGKTVTWSVLAVGGDSAFSANINKNDSYVDSFTIEPNTISFKTLTFPTDFTDISFVFAGNSAGHVCPIAAKLELGPTQTLAHKEGDKWVLNEVPDYGEQLWRCQMDLFKIGDAVRYCSLGNGVARDGQFVSITIPTPVTMRTVPVLIAPPVGFAMRHNDTIVSGGANFSVDAFSQNSIMLKVQSQVALTPGDMWEAFLQPNGSLVFSAEL